MHCKVLFEGDLVLVYDQEKDTLGVGKFNLLWHGPYIVKCDLQKGAYELEEFEGNALLELINGIYLKKYYA
jgi:hypothetical protein